MNLVSADQEKNINTAVDLYKKYIVKTKKYYAHDPENNSKPGDAVSIVESRPRSKMKKWFLKEIINKDAK